MGITTNVIRAEGDRVFANIGGRMFLDLEWKAALELGQAFVAAARQAEEVAKAERIAFDSAILVRAGVPFTLSNRPEIIEMTKVEAVHNRTLRRAMQGIKSASVVGMPVLFQEKPR